MKLQTCPAIAVGEGEGVPGVDVAVIGVSVGGTVVAVGSITVGVIPAVVGVGSIVTVGRTVSVAVGTIEVSVGVDPSHSKAPMSQPAACGLAIPR